MNLRRLLALFAFYVATILTATSQNVGVQMSGDGSTGSSTPAYSGLWNSYEATRLFCGADHMSGSAFRTIVGAANSTFLTYSASNSFALPVLTPSFNFAFLPSSGLGSASPAALQNYPSNQIWVHANGAVAFGATAPPLTLDLVKSTGTGSQLLMAYLGNIIPVGSNGAWYQVQGVAPNRKLVIEWVAQGGPVTSGTPGGASNFQCVLFEDGLTGLTRGKVLFHYGPTSIAMPVPTGNQPDRTGASIGIKNQGQILQNPPTRTGANLSERFLLMTDPSRYQTSANVIANTTSINASIGVDSISITAMPVNTVTGILVSELFAHYPLSTSIFTGQLSAYGSQASRYFHYNFPVLSCKPLSYRFQPTNVDIACVTDTTTLPPAIPAPTVITPTPLPPAYPLPAIQLGVISYSYPVNTSLVVSQRFKNIGGATSLPGSFKLDVFRHGVTLPITSVTAASAAIASNTITTVTFPSLAGLTFFSSPGTYTFKMYNTTTGDQNAENDTCEIRVFIRYPDDVMAVSVLQPAQNIPPYYTRYTTGVDIPIEFRYANIGNNTQVNVPVKCVVYKDAGNCTGTKVWEKDSIIALTGTNSWKPQEFRDMTFSSPSVTTPPGQPLIGFRPSTPGKYYVKTWINMSSDQNRSNDTIPLFFNTYPYTYNYCMKNPAPIVNEAGYEFEVFLNTSISLNPGTPYGPQFNACVGRVEDVYATLLNYGTNDAINVPTTCEIREGSPSGNIIYTSSKITTVVPKAAPTGAPGSRTQFFDKWIPNAPGVFYVSVTFSPTVTVQWVVVVSTPLSGNFRVGQGERFRTIQDARDELFRCGVNAPVVFELIEDYYHVAPGNANAGLSSTVDMPPYAPFPGATNVYKSTFIDPAWAGRPDSIVRNTATAPALDFRGTITGASATNTITFKPAAGKSNVHVRLCSFSGIGIWYGQDYQRTNVALSQPNRYVNPTGYIIWDGGTGKKLEITYENLTTATGSMNPVGDNRYYNCVPIFIGTGSSNYTVKNCKIHPLYRLAGAHTESAVVTPTLNSGFAWNNLPGVCAGTPPVNLPNTPGVPYYGNHMKIVSQCGTVDISEGKKGTQTLSSVQYNGGSNLFIFDPDQFISSPPRPGATMSAGIYIRSILPNTIAGNNPSRWDTLNSVNNRIDSNEIENFAYGVVSSGMGPIYSVVRNGFVEYVNSSNVISNNYIKDVSRAGIALEYEKRARVERNRIENVINPSPNLNPTMPRPANINYYNQEHAVGIYVTPGDAIGGATSIARRGYSSELVINANSIRTINANAGNGAGIWVESSENVFSAPGGNEFRFPAVGETKDTITNNFIWDYVGQNSQTVGTTFGIGMSIEAASAQSMARFITVKNRIENNTIYNFNGGRDTLVPFNSPTARLTREYGIGMWRSSGSVRNNIVAITGPSSSMGMSMVPEQVGLSYQTTTDKPIESDYNLVYMWHGKCMGNILQGYMNGFVGEYRWLDSKTGFNIPTTGTQGASILAPSRSRTLNEWKYDSKLDQNSIWGSSNVQLLATVVNSPLQNPAGVPNNIPTGALCRNIVDEFYSVAKYPDSVNLHINKEIVGGLTNDRGIRIPYVKRDIDADPRPALTTTYYDIGADEYVGQLYNYDLMAEDIVEPRGFYEPNFGGSNLPAEYVMSDTMINIKGRFRNIGGQPIIGDWDSVKLRIEALNPTPRVGFTEYTDIPLRVDSFTVWGSPFDANAVTKDITFPSFKPKTIAEFGLGALAPLPWRNSANVSPLYRITIEGIWSLDQNLPNNKFTKFVRFYLPRSKRGAVMSVKSFYDLPTPTPTPTGYLTDSIANKLNADTLYAAMRANNWERVDNIGLEDFDIFERDKWPINALNLKMWNKIIWSQGENYPMGIDWRERVAIKECLNEGTMFNKRTLVIAGQEIARTHDVLLNATNGLQADTDFVRNYLRCRYIGKTNPGVYSGLQLIGKQVTPQFFELINETGAPLALIPGSLPAQFAAAPVLTTSMFGAAHGDPNPTPDIVKPVLGPGAARATYNYYNLAGNPVDSAAGIASSNPKFVTVFYAIDWRHFGRYAPQALYSGAPRALRAALDFASAEEVLPIKIANFDAFQSGRSAVTIDWTTLSEVNVAGMEIQRAVVEKTEAGDKVGNYVTIDKMSSKGNATTGAYYKVVDNNVKAGVEYSYRLVTADLDGTRHNDAEKRVLISNATTKGYSLALSPNPVVSSGKLSITAPVGEKVKVVIYNELGKQVAVAFEGTVSANEEVAISDLKSGSYTARMENSKGVVTEVKIAVVR